MSHYFTNDDVKTNIKLIKGNIKNTSIEIFTDNNIFSRNKIDYGTKLLLENIKSVHGDVLDLGCGYGIIGIYLKLNNANISVDMIDINRRAVEISKKNIEKYGLEKINVFESNGFEKITKKYDYIITNPPIRIGKIKLFSLFETAKDYLNENGKIIFVIKKEQGAKSLEKALIKKYKTSLLNKSKGYFVFLAERI